MQRLFSRISAATLACVMVGAAAHADERPALGPQPRYTEDYRFLADPAKRSDFYDPIKYIPLGDNPNSYLSFGGEIRERFEGFENNPLFGLTGLKSDNYLLHRALLHADLHANEYFRAFVQIGHHRVFGKEGATTPTEEGGVDLQQAFAEVTLPLAEPKENLGLRVGRQEIALGSQRLVSVREGPNIRQSFDAARGTYTNGPVSVTAFASHPVTIGQDDFDDNSDNAQRFWGVYGVTPIGGGLNADLYYLGLDRDMARFAEGAGREQRHSIGTRLWGKREAVDYNFEFVYQFGEFGQGDISAWTVASDTGYTLAEYAWKPRLALRADVASGDRKRGDGNLNTFNALFPRGSYFAENALIGPANFIDIHPYVSITPIPPLTLSAGADFLWRQNTNDAIYRQPNIPIAGTAGNGDSYTGTQPYVMATWQMDPHTSLTATYVHFDAGQAIKAVGGGDNDYVGGWLSYRF